MDQARFLASAENFEMYSVLLRKNWKILGFLGPGIHAGRHFIYFFLVSGI
jgi:lipid-A-disaccharide synthase-like uncharacterized protein